MTWSKVKKHKLPIRASHNESNSSSQTGKPHDTSMIDRNKQKYRDNVRSRQSESYRNELKSHEPRETLSEDSHNRKQQAQS